VATATRSNNRVATVRTEAGETVQVRGGPAGSRATSVDRNYQPGGRYEFHPINASSPFHDNICTATRLLSQDPVPASAQPDRTPAAALAASAAVGPVVAALLICLTRSRRRRMAE